MEKIGKLGVAGLILLTLGLMSSSSIMPLIGSQQVQAQELVQETQVQESIQEAQTKTLVIKAVNYDTGEVIQSKSIVLAPGESVHVKRMEIDGYRYIGGVSTILSYDDIEDGREWEYEYQKIMSYNFKIHLVNEVTGQRTETRTVTLHSDDYHLNLSEHVPSGFYFSPSNEAHGVSLKEGMPTEYTVYYIPYGTPVTVSVQYFAQPVARGEWIHVHQKSVIVLKPGESYKITAPTVAGYKVVEEPMLSFGRGGVASNPLHQLVTYDEALKGRNRFSLLYEKSADTPPTSSKNIYRLYDRTTNQHFYTSNNQEVSLLQSRGWRLEGTAWKVSSAKQGTAVYRVWNTKTGERIFTRHKTEVDRLASRGWKNEGIAFYTQASGQPIYRLPNKQTGRYLLTVGQAEVAKLVATGQWQNEGVAFYGVQ